MYLYIYIQTSHDRFLGPGLGTGTNGHRFGYSTAGVVSYCIMLRSRHLARLDSPAGAEAWTEDDGSRGSNLLLFSLFF